MHVPAFHGPINGQITIPGSKSVTNRALLMAALANGESKLRNGLDSDDTRAMIQVLRDLGVPIQMMSDCWLVTGCGGKWPQQSGSIYMGSAGTVARFVLGALAAAPSGQWRLDASEQLKGRPIQGVLDPLKQLGANIETCPETIYPIQVCGGQLKGGTVEMSGKTSSQFISGLLIAAPLASSPVKLRIIDHIVQSDYVNITTHMMQSFGVKVAQSGLDFVVSPQSYQAQDISIEADASTATYFMGLAALSGGKVRLNNINRATHQPDIAFLDICKKMGCAIHEENNTITVQGPPKLKGGFTQDMRPMSDATLTLAALAPFADAPIEIVGVEHIRHHECDRLATIAAIFSQLGIPHHERSDGIKIEPKVPQFGRINPQDDHRVAMAMTLLGLKGNGIEIETPSCVAKTCPMYFDLIKEFGVACHKLDG